MKQIRGPRNETLGGDFIDWRKLEEAMGADMMDLIHSFMYTYWEDNPLNIVYITIQIEVEEACGFYVVAT
jgi:hypothetical protein